MEEINSSRHTPKEQKIIDENIAHSTEFTYGSSGTEPVTLFEGDKFEDLTLINLDFF